MRWLSQLLLLMLTVAVSQFAAADNDALSILERMTKAAKQHSYEGVFAYQSGRNLQSIRIIHRVDEDGELERLVSLNGAAREVIRSNDQVTCIYPEGKQVNVSRRPLGRGFPSDLPRRLNSAMPYYKVELGQAGRVADRQAQELMITPIDNYRYGYRLWVDKETDLLLKAELLADNGAVLEAFTFTALTTGINIPDYMFDPQNSGKEMTWHRSEPASSVKMAEQGDLSSWRLTWLPDGFVLVALQNRLRANNGAQVEQRVYSDGLSSVSVFIEKIASRHTHLRGGSHMGAVNAFGTIIDAHFVTVVGELPAVTVKRIGAAIESGAAE